MIDRALTEGHSVLLTLKTINAQEFMHLAIQACQQMGWRFAGSAEDLIVFYTNGSNSSDGEEIVIRTADNKANVSSRCISEYRYDQQQNVQNILAFRSALSIGHTALMLRKNPRSKTTQAVNPFEFNIQNGWGAIVPSERYLVTPILIYINVFILLLMTLAGLSPTQPTASSLLGWGGNFQSLVLKGEYWRLFTYMFLHGGIAHLAGNVFALLYVGLHLEPILGRVRYLSAYILTGIFAGLVSMFVHGYSVGVGASGAIFGLYGVFLALLSTRYIQGTIRSTMLRSLLFFIVYNLLMGIQGNTDNAAHIGGLISGMAIGYVFLSGLRKGDNKKSLPATVSILSVIVLIISAAVIFFLKQVN